MVKKQLNPLRFGRCKDGQCVPFAILNLLPSKLIDVAPRGYAMSDIERFFAIKSKPFAADLELKRGEFCAVMACAARPNNRLAHFCILLIDDSEKPILIDAAESHFLQVGADYLQAIRFSQARIICDESGATWVMNKADFPHIYQPQN